MNSEVRVKEVVFQRIFNHLRDEFDFKASDRKDFRWGHAEYNADAKLARGRLDLQTNGGGSVLIKELDFEWEDLRFSIAFDIPEICVGGHCILKNPISGKCVKHAPKWCIFESDSDIGLTINLTGLPHEFSLATKPDLRKSSNKWELFLRVWYVDINFIDWADWAGNLIKALGDYLDDKLSGWPGWAKNLVLRIIGGIEQLLRRVLDIPDDIDEWLSNLFGHSLGFLDAIIQYVGNHWLATNPLVHVDTPYEVEGDGMNLKVPLPNMEIEINDTEAAFRVEIGA